MRSQLSRLCEGQNHRCCYCGVRMIFRDERPTRRRLQKWDRFFYLSPEKANRRRYDGWRMATRDHFVAECFGGGNDDNNIIIACNWCNNYRGNAPAEVAFERIARLIERGTHPHVIYERTGRFDTRNFKRLRTVQPQRVAA